MQAKKSLGPGIVMIVVSLIFLSQALVMEKASIIDPAEGSFFPALISIIMLISGITVLIPRKKRATNIIEEKAEIADDDTDDIFTGKDYRFILIFFAMIVIYVILLSIISFFPATFLFLVASMYYLKDVSWKMNLIVSLGSIIVIYILFSQLFHIIFP